MYKVFVCTQACTHFPTRVGRASGWNQSWGCAFNQSGRAKAPAGLWPNPQECFQVSTALPFTVVVIQACVWILHVDTTASFTRFQLSSCSCVCALSHLSAPLHIEWIMYTFQKKEQWLAEDSNWILGAKQWILGGIEFFLKLFEAVRWWNRARDVSKCGIVEKYLMWLMPPITSSIWMCVGKGGLILSGIN